MNQQTNERLNKGQTKEWKKTELNTESKKHEWK